MNLKIWNFPKRLNSTKVPTSEAPWSPGVELKAPTSMLTPIFRLGSQEDFEQINSYNYLQIDNGPYYFIEYWTSVREHIWDAHCKLDYLATYRSEIFATSAFVEYDTSPNPGIVDYRLSNLVFPSYDSVQESISVFSSAPSFVVGVTGKGGCVSYFSMSLSYLNRLLDDVESWSEISVEDSGDSVGDLLLAFLSWARKSLASGNAPQNIRSCVWLPWSTPGTPKDIYLGTYKVGFGGQEVTEPISHFRADLTIPWQASDWRMSPNNHSFELYLPYVGVVAIDAGLIAGQTQLTVFYAIDNRDGSIAYKLTCGGCNIGSYSGCAGVNVPIGITQSTLPQVIGGISQIASTAMGNSASLTGLSQTAMNLINPSISCIGTLNGGASSGVAGLTMVLTSIYHPTNVTPSSVSTVMGTPSMSVKQIGTLSGFVKTRGVSVEANAGGDELTVINNMLDGGVFIE